MERHGFSSPLSAFKSCTTGELSPMAFLVGVSFVHSAGHPHPVRPATWPGSCVRGKGRRWPVQAADAPPSPLFMTKALPSS